MPSAKRGGRGRSAIPGWRVKLGNREVFAAPKKGDCAEWIRRNPDGLRGKLRLIPPNA